MTTEETDSTYKRMWNDHTTKLLITEFKQYYELWKNGTIGKKLQMWQKISEALNKKGLECTAGQAENRFKTLQRSYRKACGILPSSRSARKFNHSYTGELSNIFVENLSLLQNNGIEDDDDDAIIIDGSSQHTDEDNGVQQFLDESTGSIFTLTPQIVSLPRNRPIKEEVKDIFSMMEQNNDDSNESRVEIINDDDDDTDDSELFTVAPRKQTRFTTNRSNQKHTRNIGARIDKIINSNEQILNKASNSQKRLRSQRMKATIANRRKPVSVLPKSNVDVLIEMKELLKKIEIRRQARHEQNIKIATERNAIMRRKNELLENLLSKE